MWVSRGVKGGVRGLCKDKTSGVMNWKMDFVPHWFPCVMLNICRSSIRFLESVRRKDYQLNQQCFPPFIRGIPG